MQRIAVKFSCGNSAALLQQLLQWTDDFRFVAYLNSNNYSDIRYGQYSALVAVAHEDLPFNDLSNRFSQLEKYHNQKDWLFGYLSYDLKNDVEKLSSGNAEYLNLPEIFFFRPEYLFELNGNELTIHSSKDDHHQVFKIISEIKTVNERNYPPAEIKLRTDKNKYLKNVESIKQQIIDGDFYELNYCQQFFCEQVNVSALSLYSQLNSISPAPFSAFLKLNKQFVISSSPERFLAKKNDRLISQPMKGTRKRNLQDKVEDERLLQELVTSTKERAENLMIVDLVRNDLSRSAVTGSVTAEEICGTYSFPQVHQMISTITSNLNSATLPVDAIKYAFPMGSMTGAPKIEVMRAIEHYEDVKRGVYSGAIGYFNPNGDFDFNVAIRTMIYDASTHLLSYHAGSAITYDAVAEQEYEECLLKASAFRQVMGGI